MFNFYLSAFFIIGIFFFIRRKSHFLEISKEIFRKIQEHFQLQITKLYIDFNFKIVSQITFVHIIIAVKLMKAVKQLNI